MIGPIASAWAGFRSMSPEARRAIGIAALIAIGIAAVWWLRADAADDALRDRENEVNRGRLENIKDAKETERDIENLDDDGFGAAIDRLPRSDSGD